MASLQKFFAQQERRGQKLFWGRAAQDGAPFRGAAPPLFTDDEYDQRVVRVVDVRAEFFNLDEAADKAAYLEVLDGVANGWFTMIFIERFRGGANAHYVEWAEFYLEDGSRAKASAGGTEVNLGNHT